MTPIEIDFDVFKALTSRRSCEDETYNDVLRELLGLDPVVEISTTAKHVEGCVFLGVHFPEGTQFRATYKGKMHSAEICTGRWMDEDGTFRNSPSDAARAITKTNVNGWRFWKVKRPRDIVYQLMEKLK